VCFDAQERRRIQCWIQVILLASLECTPSRTISSNPDVHPLCVFLPHSMVEVPVEEEDFLNCFEKGRLTSCCVVGRHGR
jgi:hypothetical protein